MLFASLLKLPRTKLRSSPAYLSICSLARQTEVLFGSVVVGHSPFLMMEQRPVMIESSSSADVKEASRAPDVSVPQGPAKKAVRKAEMQPPYSIYTQRQKNFI